MSRETDLSDEAKVAERPDLEDLALDEDYALTAEFVDMVIDAADRGDGPRLTELVAALRPADVADLMGFLSELEDNIREEVLEIVAPATLAKALEDLESDDAADVVDDLDEKKRESVL